MTSSGRITSSPAGRLAEWMGRLLLLGAVAFWWGAIFVPRLVSLTFPELLPPDAIPSNLNPDDEGSFANGVSALLLLVTALLAFANAIVSHRRSRRLSDSLRTQDWIAAAGWLVLAITAVYLAWEEVSEFHAEGTRAFGEIVLGAAYPSTLWPVVMSPMIVAFVLAMGVFVGKGLPSTGSGRDVRALVILGLAAWLMAIVQEVGHTFKASLLTRLLEESLEFGGTLVIGLGAAIALRGRPVLGPSWQAFRPSTAPDVGRRARDASRRSGGRARFPLTVWGMAAIVIIASAIALGAVASALYRAPLADARSRSHVGAFQLLLPNSAVGEHSVVQELGTIPAPLARIDLRVANHDTQGRPGTLIWRVMEADGKGLGRILREGMVEVPAGEQLRWERIDFPPLVEAEGRPLALQLVAELGPGGHLRIGATKTNRYQDGRLWVNGALAWPDQNIEFAVYMAAEPTLAKLRTVWNTFTSDWGWPVMMAQASIGMTVVSFIPALLVTAALRQRGSP